MPSRARLILLVIGCTLGTSLRAQPVFTGADFQHLMRAHTRTSMGMSRPDTLTPLTHLTGGPHVFDLTAIVWGSSSVQENAPVVCEPGFPGCQDADLGDAAVVLRTRQDGRDVYRFQDLTDDGFYDRGSASATANEAGIPVEGLLAFKAADRVLAFPLSIGRTWTNHTAAHLQADGVVSVSSEGACTREVVAWGTLRTVDQDVAGLFVRAQCVTTFSLDGQLLRDTSQTFQFLSPTRWLTLEVAADGIVRSASLDVFDAVATAVEAESVASGISLHAPRPNPSRGAAAVAFSLDTPAPVTLDVFDVLGRHVARLADGVYAAGTHAATWAGDAPSGLYVVRLRTGAVVRTRTLTRVD